MLAPRTFASRVGASLRLRSHCIPPRKRSSCSLPPPLPNRQNAPSIALLLGYYFGKSARSAVVYNTEENETILEKVWSALSSDESEGASYQQDLWQTVLQRKTRNNRLTITGSSDTSELFLQSLTTAYNQNGLAQKMPRIREIFSDIEPFVSAINTMVQANAVAALV
ncbi:hypothetical protein BGZ57DRAFT_934406 [Hyaloscypha finlandica]|nr:hypothetical protein BGZ57DRAFT_934406 [Hyaloscypha finlandica]